MDPGRTTLTRIRSFIPIAAVPFLLLSCSGDGRDNGPFGPGSSTPPPPIPTPRLAYHPKLPTNEPTARDARAIVNAQINMISYATRNSATAIAAMNSGSWEMLNRSCWSKERGAPRGHGCSSALRACFQGAQCEYTETVDGRCPVGIQEERVFNDWLHLQALTTPDAKAGAFFEFEDGTAVVERAWRWEISETPPSGSWSFYQGDIREVNLLARLIWTREEDGTEHAAWVWTEMGKWESIIAPDGLTGRMAIHQWQPGRASWVLRHAIEWTPAHGTWKTYDDAGSVTEEKGW